MYETVHTCWQGKGGCEVWRPGGRTPPVIACAENLPLLKKNQILLVVSASSLEISANGRAASSANAVPCCGQRQMTSIASSSGVLAIFLQVSLLRS